MGAPALSPVRRSALLILALAILVPFAGRTDSASAEALLGAQTIGGEHDSNSPGSAEAFGAIAAASGVVGSLTVYVDSGATPNATTSTGPKTDWLMATLVFKAASTP